MKVDCLKWNDGCREVHGKIYLSIYAWKTANENIAENENESCERHQQNQNRNENENCYENENRINFIIVFVVVFITEFVLCLFLL